MLTRNEMVAEVLALYDKVEEPAEAVEAYHSEFYEVGRKKVYNDALCMPYLHRERTGELETFDEWLKHELGCIPDYMSRDEFAVEFADELHATYDALVAKRNAEDAG